MVSMKKKQIESPVWLLSGKLKDIVKVSPLVSNAVSRQKGCSRRGY